MTADQYIIALSGNHRNWINRISGVGQVLPLPPWLPVSVMIIYLAMMMYYLAIMRQYNMDNQ